MKVLWNSAAPFGFNRTGFIFWSGVIRADMGLGLWEGRNGASWSGEPDCCSYLWDPCGKTVWPKHKQLFQLRCDAQTRTWLWACHLKCPPCYRCSHKTQTVLTNTVASFLAIQLGNRLQVGNMLSPLHCRIISGARTGEGEGVGLLSLQLWRGGERWIIFLCKGCCCAALREVLLSVLLLSL